MIKGVDYIGVAIGAMIFNEKGEVFLSKRGPKTRNEKGKWEFPGGGVRFGEKLEDAVKREMKEEYAIDIEIISFLGVSDHLIPEEKQHWVASTFIARIVSGEPKIMEPEKCDAIEWFSLDSMPENISIVTRMDLGNYMKKFGKSAPF